MVEAAALQALVEAAVAVFHYPLVFLPPLLVHLQQVALMEAAVAAEALQALVEAAV